MNFAFRSLALSFLLVGCATSDEASPVDAIAETAAEAATDTATVDTSADTKAGDAATDSSSDAPSDSSSDSGADSGSEPADTGEVCTGAFGSHCDDANPCADGTVCFGSGSTGFCAPPTPECGGFVNKKCPDGLACLYGPGSDRGFCADAPQKVCICSHISGVDGC